MLSVCIVLKSQKDRYRRMLLCQVPSAPSAMVMYVSLLPEIDQGNCTKTEKLRRHSPSSVGRGETLIPHSTSLLWERLL